MSKRKQSTRAERLQQGSQERREQEKQEVRQAIIRTASDLYLKHGYEKFSLRQVAEEIGYSPGTIYLYFKNKDDILYTIMVEGVVEFQNMIGQAMSNAKDSREKLLMVGQAYIEFGLQHPAYYQLMFIHRTDFMMRAEDDGNQQAYSALMELWQAMVSEAMRDGVLKMGDPVAVGDALWALLHGVVTLALLMPDLDEARIRKMIDTALDMAINGLNPA